MHGEPEVFQNASRDFSFSLAQVVTGELYSKHKTLLRILKLTCVLTERSLHWDNVNCHSIHLYRNRSVEYVSNILNVSCV